MNSVSEPKPTSDPLRIFELIKKAQQKHGLRHENYQRYRGYCGRRIERIKKSLKFTNHYKCFPKRPAKFTSRVITPDQVGDIRFIQIVVFEAERNWAYAMELKYEAMDQPLPRKKFHMRRKLNRAVKWAKFLETLLGTNDLVHDITKLEMKAYGSFIHGSLSLELKNWLAAVHYFDISRFGYEQLLEQLNHADLLDIYSKRYREIENLLKLCRSQSGDIGVLLPTVDALNLNASDDIQIQEAISIEEAQKPTKVSRRKQKKEARLLKEPKPFKPFFFDLALNFVSKPVADESSRQ